MTKHQVSRKVMGQLVYGGRRELVACVQAAQETRSEEQRAVVMNIGIAEISRGRVSSVLRVDAFQVFSDVVEGLVPMDALPAGGSAPQRMSKTIAVEMKVLQGDGLGADVAATEGIVFIATNS